MIKSLIINADDFGLSYGVNSAIVSCYRAGSLSSTTLMVNMPATVEAISLAKDHPGLGVGLHFNLSLGEPICSTDRVSSLVGSDGVFHMRGTAEKKAMCGQLRPEEILEELEAQWGVMLAHEILPTHIDSHQHIHVFPSVFDVVARFCADKNIPVRVPKPWKPSSAIPLKRHIRMWTLKRMVRRNMNRWNERLATNESFASIFDLQIKPKDINSQRYREILLAEHKSPLELMIHPAEVDLEHTRMTGISEVSRLDYEIFSRENFGAVARDLGYVLVNYSNLKR